MKNKFMSFYKWVISCFIVVVAAVYLLLLLKGKDKIITIQVCSGLTGYWTKRTAEMDRHVTKSGQKRRDDRGR